MLIYLHRNIFQSLGKQAYASNDQNSGEDNEWAIHSKGNQDETEQGMIAWDAHRRDISLSVMQRAVGFEKQ